MAYTFKVEDMTCGGCAASIKRAVEQVPGVKEIAADPATNRVVVDTAGQVDRQTIVAAINAAGYSEITVIEA